MKNLARRESATYSSARKTAGRGFPASILGLLAMCTWITSHAGAQRPQLDWTRQFGGLSASTEGATAVGVDGSIYVAGTTTGTLPGQVSAGATDCFLRKYDATGIEQWTRQFGTAGNDAALGLAVDANGVYVVGSVTGSLGGQMVLGGKDAFVRKYDAAGIEAWTRQFGTAGDDEARAIAVDGGSLYLCGTTASTLDGQVNHGRSDAFTQKCDLDGNPAWTRLEGSADNDAASAITLYAGSVYVAGSAGGSIAGQPASSRDGFVLQYDTNGFLGWARLFGSPFAVNAASGVAADASGVYVCDTGSLPQHFQNGGSDVLLLKFTHQGNFEWSRQEGTANNDTAAGVALGGGRVYLAGSCGGSLRAQPRLGSVDGFVLQYDTEGNPGWTFQFGCPGSTRATAIAFSGGRLLLSGNTTGTLPGQTSSGGQDAFAMALLLGEGPVDSIAPVANAGVDQAVHPGVTAVLNGGGSNDDTSATNRLVFEWSFTARPAGSQAVLSNSRRVSPSFTVDAIGEYRVQLVVTDEQGNRSAADEVVLSSMNLAPTADAGADQVLMVDTVAILDGSASYDPDLDPIRYSWAIAAAPAGSSAFIQLNTMGQNSPYAYLIPDVAGTYELQLVASDPWGGISAPDTLLVVAVTPTDFAQMSLQAVCAEIHALTAADFDAPGHQESLCNELVQIVNFIQQNNLAQARAHLADVITRTDGWTLRGALDPKGQGQPNAADFVVTETAQRDIYVLLTDALNALNP